MIKVKVGDRYEVPQGYYPNGDSRPLRRVTVENILPRMYSFQTAEDDDKLVRVRFEDTGHVETVTAESLRPVKLRTFDPFEGEVIGHNNGDYYK